MSREIPIPNLDDLVEQYQAGKSLKKISDETGYGRNVLFNRFRKCGVKIRS